MSTHNSTSNYSNHNFNKGDEIEVLRNSDDGTIPAWFPATIINPLSPSGTLHVKFNTLFVEKNGKRKKIREYVDVNAGLTRPPVPTPETQRRFVIGEEVEVFHEKGWRKGKVKDVLEDYSKYRVVIGGFVEVVVKNRKIRVSRDWKQDGDGSCVRSNLGPQEVKSSQLILQSKKGTKLKIIFKVLKTVNFQKGTPVEVRSDEEGYHGSWFTATIVGSVDEDKFMVQYDTLTTDDEMQPLVEMAYASNIRPLPPIINRMGRFKMLEIVDAWYNDGWWVGLVSKVVAGLKYVVYFWTTNEEFEFEHSKLRPHQEFINGKWVASFLRPKLAAKPRLEKVKIQTGGRTLMTGLLRGLKVEIAHREEGYLSIWYPAVILGPGHNGKYLVEYRSLKTDNGLNLVKEEVDVLSIRPCPPIIQRADPFQLNYGVDAWDVKMWRIGRICRTMSDSKYAVYFRATNSVDEFQHADLRPHQDFIDGTWLLAAMDIPSYN